jgi:hypothetical protein
MTELTNDNPHHLYSLAEVASYSGRSLQLLRMYYSQGLLPDPKHTKVFKTKKMRKFTLAEAKQIKNFFASVKRNSLKPIKNRAAERKKYNAPRETKGKAKHTRTR